MKKFTKQMTDELSFRVSFVLFWGFNFTVVRFIVFLC